MITKDDISIEQVFSILEELDGEPKWQSDEVITSKTICHGGNSHKLYYYENSRLFHCYTNCEQNTFNIFQLISKVKPELSFPYNVFWVESFLGISSLNFSDGFTIETFGKKSKYWEILDRYDEINSQGEKKNGELPTYDNFIVEHLPKAIIAPWEKEGMKREVIDMRGIRYNPKTCAVVIPHYNINGELVGIRERTLIKDYEKFGKYMPTVLNGKMYNHPLGFNLYNLNNTKDNIKIAKRAIVFESEKATLQYASMAGIDNDISVAACGSSITKYQFNLLLNLGINELIIAFDRQFQKIGDEEYYRWIKKLKTLSKKFHPYCEVSFVFDTTGLLDYKDAPVDKGKETFQILLNNRLNYEGKRYKR